MFQIGKDGLVYTHHVYWGFVSGQWIVARNVTYPLVKEVWREQYRAINIGITRGFIYERI